MIKLKKLNKRIGTIALAAVISSSMLMPVEAATVFKSTGYKKLPLAGGMTGSTLVYSLNCSKTTITGELVGAKFKSVLSLSNDYVSNSNRVVWMYLKEDDADPNEDDYVKTYKATFSGRSIKDIILYRTDTAGNIDSKYDSTGELYVEAEMTKFSGDRVTYTEDQVLNVNIVTF